MTVAEPVQEPLMKVPSVPVENRILLYAVDWDEYTKFLEAVGNRRVRLTYDQGTLEFMTVSRIHDWWGGRIGFVLRLLGAVLNVTVQGYGKTTLRRKDVERGLEPDEEF